MMLMMMITHNHHFFSLLPYLLLLQLEFEVDEFRKRLQSVKTEKQNQLLVKTSVIQGYQTEIEKMIQNIKLQDDEVLKVDDKKKDISRELSQTIQAIRNLFGRGYICMCVDG